MNNLEINQDDRLTREDVQPIIERLGRVCDHGWNFSEFGLMALISETEDLVRLKKSVSGSTESVNQPEYGDLTG